jgi:C-terminal processing protease CtpA/Prc
MFKTIIISILYIFAIVGCAKTQDHSVGRQVENLRAFSKLYGYVSFFHPSDEASNIDCEKFAVYGSKEVLNAQNDEELKSTLNRLFLPLAPTAQIYGSNETPIDISEYYPQNTSGLKVVSWQHSGVWLSDSSNIYRSVRLNSNNQQIDKNFPYGVPSKLFENEVKIGEVIEKNISDKIKCRIPLALYRDSLGTLGKNKNFSYEQLNSDMLKLKSERLNADNEYVRIADVIITWNVMQHFYPYFDVIPVDWDAELTEALKESIADTTADQFYFTLRKMIAKLQDGHGVVYYQPEEKIGSLPLRVEFIEGQIVITASRDFQFQKGDIIKSIDGRSGIEVLKEREQYVSGSPQLRRFRALNEFFDGPLSKTAKLVVLRDDIVITTVIERKEKEGNLFHNLIPEFVFPPFKEIGKGIYYINFASVTKKEMYDSLNVLANAKGIIFDSRSDGNMRAVKDKFLPHVGIIPYLMDKEFYSAPWYIPNVIYPDRKGITFTEGHWTMEPAQPRIKAKIVIINDPSVVSYGESYMGIFENYKLAEFVGEQTAGTNGNVNFIILPGGFKVMWTGMKVVKQNGDQHHLIGIKPTYPVKRTIEAVKAGRDEYLEKAMEIMRGI